MLLRKNLEALSSFEAQSVLSNQLTQLKNLVMGPDNELSLENKLGALRDALQQYAASPANNLLAEAAVDSAKQLATRLNETSAQIQSFRETADQSIGADVAKLTTCSVNSSRPTTMLLSVPEQVPTPMTRSTAATRF